MRRLLGALATIAVAAGCDGVEPRGLPWEARPFPEPIAPADNPTTPEKVELGRLLFYDPVLGADGETACATCHSEIWGMGDGLPRSIGVGGGTLTGPGRQGDNATDRNAQTLWNVAWRRTLFWDGRESSLEHQALAPLHSEVELARAPGAVVAELTTIDAYVAAFTQAFPDSPEPVSVVNLTRALAAFQRTLVSDRSLYDAYAAGDDAAMTDDEVAGMWLFAEAGCDGCHTPPLFESERFADRGVGDWAEDAGRGDITGRDEDRGAFRVPTLRNVRESGPYFHDGSVRRLADAVTHELALAETRAFSAHEAALITRFIGHTLVDARAEPHRPTTVPSGLPVPEDGFRIPR